MGTCATLVDASPAGFAEVQLPVLCILGLSGAPRDSAALWKN